MDFSESGLLGKILEAEEARTCMGKNCPMPQGEFPAENPVAMAYVPFQSWERTYDSEARLSRGTVFPSLDKPFIGEEALRRGND